MTAYDLIKENMGNKPFNMIADDGETYYVTSGRVNLYFIIRDGKIVDVQVD